VKRRSSPSATELQVVVEPGPPRESVLDTALSRALFQRVAAGELPQTLRLTRPAPAVVFGKQDALNAGYAAAAAAARARGFEPVLRVAGGRAAVFHEGTIALAHAVPDPAPRKGIHARFEASAALVEAALGRVGVEARVGEVPGEYCPGTYSVNAGGERKLAGLGQRLVRGASYMGGVLVVSDSARVREVLTPVYDALGLEWDPSTTGAVAEEVDIAWRAVVDALLAEYALRFDLVEAELDEQTVALAQRLLPEHRAG
jgi:octanoyl-[GcvH]:protein N-octanoyltransferase